MAPAESNAASIEPADRSPLEFPFGLFIADASNYGGAQGFAWFDSEAAALDYLRNELWQLYDFDETDAEELETDLRGAIAASLNGLTDLKSIPLEILNQIQHVFELRWAGQLDDLLIGKTPFEEEIQYDFRQNLFGEERGMAESDLVDFATHLLNYHG
jgi:hypothetical protein